MTHKTGPVTYWGGKEGDNKQSRSESAVDALVSANGFAIGDYVEHYKYPKDWHGQICGSDGLMIRVMVGAKKLLFWPQNLRKI